MEVVSVGHQKLNFPGFRRSALSVQVLGFQNNQHSIHNLSNETNMDTQVGLHYKKYEPKTHFPPNSYSHQNGTTNAYKSKVPLKDLINTLELVENVPQLFYESNSESLELSSNTSSAPTTSRYIPPPGSINPIENSDVSKNNIPMLSPTMNPDLQKHIDEFRNRGTTNLYKNMKSWLMPKGTSDEEKSEFNSHCQNSPKSDTCNSYESLNPNTAPFNTTVKELDTYNVVNNIVSEHVSSGTPASSLNEPNIFKLSFFKKPHPKWFQRRNENFKTVFQECEDCICYRPSVDLLCRVCGFRATSRIKRMCKVHPNTIFLSDIGQCGTCHTYAQLGYFVELNFKKGSATSK